MLTAATGWRCAGRCLRALQLGGARLLPDDQSLSPAAGDAGGQSVARDAAFGRPLYAALQPPPRPGRASLSGALQGDPGAEGSLPAGADSLCGPEFAARRDGRFV